MIYKDLENKFKREKKKLWSIKMKFQGFQIISPKPALTTINSN